MRVRVLRELADGLELALGGRSTDNFIFPLMTKDGRRVEVLRNATKVGPSWGAGAVAH